MLNALATEAPRAELVEEAPAPEQLKEECAARARVYRLLSGVFVEEPAVKFLSALREEDTLRALEEAGVRFDSDFMATDMATLAEKLAEEYAVLFVVSGGFPPIESVRLTGRHYQAPHFAVKEAYRRAGFALEKGRFTVFEDQLGVELMFVAELLERAAALLDRDDMPSYQKIEREIKRFWVLHLGRWVRGYARLVQRATEHSFFREMARLLEAFSEDEIRLMALRVEDADQAREVVPKSEVSVLFNPDEPVCNACAGGSAQPSR